MVYFNIMTIILSIKILKRKIILYVMLYVMYYVNADLAIEQALKFNISLIIR